jgi:hypothetical protein
MRIEGYKQLERKTDPAAPRRRSSGISNEKGAMDDAFVQQHILEEKRDSVKKNIKGTPSVNSKDVSQLKVHRSPSRTMVW